jgi:cyclic beta-1,2-glucan synthetase
MDYKMGADGTTYVKTHATPPPVGAKASSLPTAEHARASSDASEKARLQTAALKQTEGWTVEPSKGNDSSKLEKRRLEALRSFEETVKRLLEQAKTGNLSPEAQSLTGNSQRVFKAFYEAGRALEDESTRKLPRIRNAEGEPMFRVYAIAQAALEATAFAFEDRDLLAYLEGFQTKQPLESSEMWALKAALQFALLEEIGVQCRALLDRESRGEQESAVDRTEASEGPLLNALVSIQSIEHVDWETFFVECSQVEKILREDPAGVYGKMDASSRDFYRQAVSELATHSQASETKVAESAVKFARQVRRVAGEDARLFGRRRHVGFYLVDEGRRRLEALVRYRVPLHKRIERMVRSGPDVSYVVGIELVTIGLIAFLLSGLHMVLPSVAAVVLLLLPATESAVRIINQLITFLIPPSRLIKMDFSEGIPDECATMAVIPTLLLSAPQVRESVEELEIRYLANADPNLHFALLADSPDSPKAFDETDNLVNMATNLIQELNRKYARQGRGSFFLFYRHRIYNESEGAWMGWERKRGKLLDLNRLLRGEFDSFPVKIGDLSVLPKIQYVITLDSDTQLPREAAHRLAGTLAHPLNRAVIDPESNIVIAGHGILQPRVGISVSSARRSRLASIYSGQTGIDPYSRAISDVYQDLFGEGTFTGKGIYEVDVYQKVLAQRFPSNALLSHDLIEGSYARAGLVSDIEVIDDYPSHFSAYSRRKHRWIRGDWQVLRWLLGRVPGYSGRAVPNPLSFISRWKILDNLRRSVIEAATLALLLGGWFFLPGGPIYWTVATLVLLLLPSYLQLALSVAGAAGSQDWTGALKEPSKSFAIEQVNVLFTLVFLLHQALVTLDAIFRTLFRLIVTHRKLLEWETAAQSEARATKSSPVEICLSLTVWISIALGLLMFAVRPGSLPEALPFLVAWACSKPIRRWLDRPLFSSRRVLTPEEKGFVRQAALRTWRFFAEWSHEGANWLVPDTVQDSPRIVAEVISPTNLGLLLNTRLAAWDLGYLTVSEFAGLTERTLDAAMKLPQYRGHFFNWSQIDILKEVRSPFVSTVDSGNLVAALWALKEGCLELLEQPVFNASLWAGLRDHLNLLKNILARQVASPDVERVLQEIAKAFETAGEECTAWVRALPELGRKAVELEGLLSKNNGGPDARRDEAVWWAAELITRLARVKETAENFTPWVLPAHRPLFLRPNTLPLVNANRLALAGLPDVLTGIQARLERLTQNEQVEFKVRSEARAFLPKIQCSLANARKLIESLKEMAEVSASLAASTDFSFLCHPQRKILSIGFDVKAQKREEACYDLLASEARTATFVAIAKGDLRQEAWFRLGRAHTRHAGQRVMLSWSGTMFEYLMPSLWMRTYPSTLLANTQQAAVKCQQEFGRRRRRPWGVSEAGYNKKDSAGRYQYQAFGIPFLALNPESSGDIVAPYASFLALDVDPLGAVRNLRRMDEMGWQGIYGFYESADYMPASREPGKKYGLVFAWLAHHQGMSLLAMANLLASSSMRRRFHAEPQVQATELILHERASESTPVIPVEDRSMPVLAVAPPAPAQ